MMQRAYRTAHMPIPCQQQPRLPGRACILPEVQPRGPHLALLVGGLSLLVWAVWAVRERQRAAQEVHRLAAELTQCRTQAAQLRQQALHDPLTRLANRALFQDRLRHALGRAARHPTPLTLLVLHLDGYKAINDRLGHPVGDQVLVAVAQRLAACLRPGDTVARLGGDEFAILLEHLGEPAAAVGVAERLLRSVQVPLLLDGQEVMISISISIGIVVSATGQEGAAALLHQADQAMYIAKRQGHGRYLLVALPRVDQQQ
jgi:diguanylate cyclase (GGDEF)-like protein